MRNSTSNFSSFFTKRGTLKRLSSQKTLGILSVSALLLISQVSLAQISETFASWTSRPTATNFTQTGSGGTWAGTSVSVFPAGAASAPGSAGNILLASANGTITLPTIASNGVNIITINAKSANGNPMFVVEKNINNTSWVTVETFSPTTTTSTFQSKVQDASDNIQLRIRSTGNKDITIYDVSTTIVPAISLAATNLAYAENFNTLASTNTAATLPSGWFFYETGTNANLTYTADNGAGTTGDTYSYGATGNTERALGGLRSNSLNPTFGARYKNNTGNIITTLTISYTGEQWRLGTIGRTDRLDFQYSTDATGLTSGTFTDVDQLDFTAPVTTGTVGALVGNNTPNRTAKSYTINGLNIPVGANFWIRWTDLDATGADDGLAVDDWSITVPTPVAPSAPVATAATNVTGTGFTANWNSVTNATSYVLDVSTNSGFGSNISYAEPFENSFSLFSATGPGAFYSGNSTSADYPASTPLYAQGNYSYGVNSNTVVLTSSGINTGATAGSSLSFKLASFSINSTDQGADATDFVTVSISPDGGSTWYNTLELLGNGNATWNFSGTGNASTAYDGNATPVTFNATPGFSAAGYATVTVTNLPASGNLKVRITMANSNPGELWLIDNFSLNTVGSSFVPGYQGLNVGNVTSYAVTGLSAGVTYYYRVRAVTAGLESPNSNTISVVPIDAESIAAFRTKAAGDFSDISIWEYNTIGSTYVPATKLPTATNSVTILHKVRLDQDFTVGTGKTFTLDNTLTPNDTFRISSGYTLTIAGTAAFSGKTVRVASTASGNASIGKITGSLSGATNVSIERYIPQNTSRAWRLLSVPTQGTQTIKGAWQEGATSISQNPKPGYGTIITSKLASWSTDGFDAKTADFSLKTYNPATGAFAGVTSTLNPIETTSGYFMYIRGDRTVTPSSSTSTLVPTTLRSTGTIYQGTQPAITVAAGTDQIIGNVYPSAVDMRQLSASLPVISIWDPKLSGTYGLGGYQTFTYNGSGYQVTPGGGSYGASGSYYNTIQLGQAFFVSAPAANSVSVQFTEAAKVQEGATYNVFDQTPVSSKMLFSNLYVIKNDSLVLADGTLQVFSNSFSDGIDGLDARKLSNLSESFYIAKLDQSLIVEKKPILTATDTIQFGMKNMAGKLYQLDIVANDINDNNLTAWLEDSYTKQRTLVNLNGTTSVKFSVDASDAASKAVDRFRIVFTGNGVLAVTYTDIRAYQKDKAVAVEWKAENQKNISNYIIERSLNGTDFAQAGTQKPTGTADQTVEYQWLDNSPAAGNNFYRVTSVDINGIKNYSKVVKVAFGAAAGFSIYPNPVTNGNISLHFNGMTKGSYTVRVLSASGALLYTKQLTYNGGDEVQTLSLGRRLVPTGRYFLELVQPDQSRTTQPLVISSK